MNGPVFWIDTAPEIDERKGVFFLIVKSGGEIFSFAMTSKNSGLLGHRASKAPKEFLARKSAIIPFPTAESGKRPKERK